MAVGRLHHAAGASGAAGRSPGSRISQLQNGRRSGLLEGGKLRAALDSLRLQPRVAVAMHSAFLCFKHWAARMYPRLVYLGLVFYGNRYR